MTATLTTPSVLTAASPTSEGELLALLHDQATRDALRTLRSATPPLAFLIRRIATQNPRHVDQGVLLRRHRGTQCVGLLADDGAYRGIPTWGTRDIWLHAVRTSIDAHPELLSRYHVSRDTVVKYADTLALYAHPRTGRRCIVANKTLRDLAGISESSIDRARRVLDDIGLRRLVYPGRRLTLDECMTARQRGCRQTGLANEAALTIPIPLWKTLTSDDSCPTRDTPTRGAPPAPQNRTVSDTYPPDDNNARPPAAQHQPQRADRRPGLALALALRQRVGWLHTEQPGRLAPLLTKYATGPLPWTPDDIVTHLDRCNARGGWTSITTDHVRTRPAALLAFYLRGVDPQADHPRGDLLIPTTSPVQAHQPPPAQPADHDIAQRHAAEIRRALHRQR